MDKIKSLTMFPNMKQATNILVIKPDTIRKYMTFSPICSHYFIPCSRLFPLFSSLWQIINNKSLHKLKFYVWIHRVTGWAVVNSCLSSIGSEHTLFQVAINPRNTTETLTKWGIRSCIDQGIRNSGEIYLIPRQSCEEIGKPGELPSLARTTQMAT